MLDYRAHKLYIILFFVPNFIVSIFSIFGLPLINYSIGVALADERIIQILISLGAIFVIELIWALFVYAFISKAFQFIFELFVDVIPHDGRTKEEAQMVVWIGDKAIRTLEICKHPTQWTQSLIDEMPKNDWVLNLFFRDELKKRLHTIFEEYLLLAPDTPYGDTEYERIFEENDLKISWQEKVFANFAYRRMIIMYSFFLLLLLYHPFG